MAKIKQTLQGWKPYAYALTTMACMALAAGAKWRPN
jgi:hypothetical protein